jgi:hypothetical protein
MTGKHNGRFVIDRVDLELVSQYNWYHDSGGYPHSTSKQDFRLHNLLAGYGVDHRNGNKLDNRRKNLRPATQAQNGQNVRTAKGAYRGVYWDGRGEGAWYGQVKHQGKRYCTPRTQDREEARNAVVTLRAALLPYAV